VTLPALAVAYASAVLTPMPNANILHWDILADSRNLEKSKPSTN